MSDLETDFFIGWQGRAPASTSRKLTGVVFVTVVLALALAAGLAAMQRTVTRASWDIDHERGFSGVLLADPVPMLVADAVDPATGASVFLLVNPWKFGFDPATARKLDRQHVRLRATVLHRGTDALLEVTRGSVAPVDAVSAPAPVGLSDFGEHTLVGEIVDGKCFLGAMNPGVLKPHRACAVRCISGGIPPVLFVRDGCGGGICYVLVSTDGRAINAEVLDKIAEPVELRGRVERRGSLAFVRIDPASIHRIP